jgi:predicted small secreted protein
MLQTEERVRRQSDLREVKEALADACHAEEQARIAASGTRKFYQEMKAQRKMWQLLRNRLEEAVLVVLVLVILSGCTGTMRGLGGLISGVGEDITRTADGIEQQIAKEHNK